MYSFYGEVVLGRIKKIYRDEENILTKYIQGKYVRIIIMKKA